MPTSPVDSKLRCQYRSTEQSGGLYGMAQSQQTACIKTMIIFLKQIIPLVNVWNLDLTLELSPLIQSRFRP